MDFKNYKFKFLKIAQEFTPPPATGTPAPVPVPTAKTVPAPADEFAPPPAAGTSPYKAPGIPEVKDMQIAMQELAAAVIRDSESATMAAKPKDAIDKGAPAPVKNAKKSFNDFIAEQYIGEMSEENKGVEWSTDPNVADSKNKKGTETDIYELDAVMDTLRRIGGAKSELNPDGSWGPRTDNALRNMMGFAYALLQLEGDFGLTNTAYTFGNWKNFQQLLSGYTIKNNKVSLSPADQASRAPDITKHLKAITKLYDHFRREVTSKSKYRPLIEGNRAFEKYNQKGSNKDVLNPAEEKFSQSDAVTVPNVTYDAPKQPNKKLDYIPLKSLRSKAEYLKWMSESAGITSEMQATKIFNDVIKPTIEKM